MEVLKLILLFRILSTLQMPVSTRHAVTYLPLELMEILILSNPLLIAEDLKMGTGTLRLPVMEQMPFR